MKFWDSSAVLPLLVGEAASGAVATVYQRDAGQVVWCLTEIEAASALSRRERDGGEREDVATAWSKLRLLAERWEEVTSIQNVRARALRLLSTHRLRAADALQLAAALVFCDERTESLPFVCLDERLADAARKERFPVLP
ncbi:MAG TPA: PIN domain-containing protein [Thermoanaerobaculia bacterium]|nr:PIN domain-containing protein [Thermoanaerobaculia bacterium]